MFRRFFKHKPYKPLSFSSAELAICGFPILYESVTIADQPGRLYTSLAMLVTAYILGTIVKRMCAVMHVRKR